MKKYLRNLSSIILLIVCHNSFSAAGLYFNIAATGAPATVKITLCLNGKGPLSCQNYTVSASTLSIVTTIPNHTYAVAGIKVHTPGYALSGCTMHSNGYCLFPASNTKAAVILLTPTKCQADVITFTPSVIRVNNPLGNKANAPQQFTLSMTMCNAHGQPIIPSASNPIHVQVYGAPLGVISPTATTTNTGSVTFTYNGQQVPNNISINAWIKDSSNNGAALGVTSILKKNTTAACAYGNTSYHIPLVDTLPNALQVMADVGYNTSAPLQSLRRFTLDTGSLGVVVPTSELAHNPNVIGPGASGVKYYDSSGNTYSGNYYLAPVRVQTNEGTVQTTPILVLGIDKAYCTGPKTRSCYSHPPTPDLHYLGIGFNRNSTTKNDLFNSPTANAFLHITNAQNGTNITPGYYLTPHASDRITGLALGITQPSEHYNIIKLAANATVPGDFAAQPGCYSFPNLPAPNQFCGTALLDIGIDYMFIDLPKAQWPAGTYTHANRVPPGTAMSILMGSVNTPSMQYNFNAVQHNPPANTPTPDYVEWINSTATGQIFVNTGRRPLYDYDYFYNGQCGQVGFKPLH